MYFLSFVKWFWNIHLVSSGDKALVLFACWMLCLMSCFFLGIILASMVPMMVLLTGTFLGFISVVMYNCFMYVRRSYLKWQSEVFDKLRKD